MRTHGKATTFRLMCGDCEQVIGQYDNEAKKFDQCPTTTYGPLPTS